MTALNFQSLKHRHRQLRDQQNQELATRIHRALSWLQRAEEEHDDPDAGFIFLWIAFNAAYAQEQPGDADYSEVETFNRFIERLLSADHEGLLYDAIWEQFLDEIKALLDSRYTYRLFWDHQRGLISNEQWQRSFHGSRRAASHAFEEMNARQTLGIIFDRLYVLRNQLMHGSATWNSQLNRRQLESAAAILGRLVPVMIHLMMEHPDSDWGTIRYPVIRD